LVKLDGERSSVRRRKILIGFVVLALLIALLVLEPHSALTLEKLRASHSDLLGMVKSRPAISMQIYFLVYVAATAVSLPGATVLTLAGSALFGFMPALLIVSFASTFGATCAFLLSRYLLRDAVQQRFGAKLEAINRGFEREGEFYLFALRLVPAFPFFAINVVMGLTPIRTWQYYWVSQIGMLPGTAAYVYAGTQLATLSSLSDVYSARILLAFSILGILPILSKRLLDHVRNQRAEKGSS
jgi:uncharacterized membrane protein YdjX (TVP38/TMEM64 family)